MKIASKAGLIEGFADSCLESSLLSRLKTAAITDGAQLRPNSSTRKYYHKSVFGKKMPLTVFEYEKDGLAIIQCPKRKALVKMT